jgi:hypothetical protein
MRATFGDKAELNLYLAQATAYCSQREAGPIRFRRSPTRNLPDNVMDYRITDVKTPSEETTDGIREAAAAAGGTPIAAVAVPAVKKSGRKAA